MGVICKPIPATQEDGSEQGAASRPDTCGDVPSPEDGGGNGHPKGGALKNGWRMSTSSLRPSRFGDENSQRSGEEFPSQAVAAVEVSRLKAHTPSQD